MKKLLDFLNSNIFEQINLNYELFF